MSSGTIAERAPPGPDRRTAPNRLALGRPAAPTQKISSGFQLLLALYIVLTGDSSTVVQAVAFGLPSGAGSEFAMAIVTAFARDLLLLLPVVVLASHPLGILHPVLLAIIVWPLLIGMPQVIEQLGGWAGVIAGVPVETPYYVGLPSRDASTVWTAIAKYNGLQIIGLLSTYAGFWFVSARRNPNRHAGIPAIITGLRPVMVSLFAASMLVLLAFLYFRGGLAQHLTSLGGGRFRELAGMGPVLLMTDLGAIALYVWIAARPSDMKSPLFLSCLVVVTASQFVSAGSRGSALTVPLFVGLIWSLRRQTVPWKMALVLLPVMFISFGFMGAIRTSSWYGSSAGEAFTTTGWADSVTIAQQELAERRANSADIPIVERGFQVSGGPLLGQSYVTVATAFIPRAFWEDKPRGTGSLYAQQFLGASRDSLGIPVSPEAEMYWNFGIPGVVILSIIYGMLLRFVYHFFWARYPDPFAIVFYALFVTRFDFGTKRFIEFEQMAGLLFLAFVVVRMFVPRTVGTVGPVEQRLPDGRAAGPSFRYS